jgi:hypothetical protein
MNTLVKFYSKVRPFGFWKPVRKVAERQGLMPVNDPMPRYDILNGVITILFQISLALIPFFLFLKKWSKMSLWILICLTLVFILYFTWYKKLPSPEET